MHRRHVALAMTCLVLGLAPASGCGKKSDRDKPKAQPINPDDPSGSQAAIQAGPGVDVAKKVVTIGALNDESGPAAGIGEPFANGKRLLVAQVNAGGSGLLPDGWTIKLVEKDHQYNPQRSVQQYNAIKGDVLFITTSFGTPNTLPLRDMLARDGIIAFPASLSSQMAAHAHTPPLGTSYKLEAERAMDWAVERAGGADAVKAGIVYQKDDYGQDGLDGWRAAAEHYGVQIVATQTVAPGDKDVTGVITSLQKAGANYVLLTTLPSSTGPILNTALSLQYKPTWIGSTPAWIDQFFSDKVLPPAALEGYYWVTSLAYWGEKIGGMDKFLAAWDQYGTDMGDPSFYTLASYAAGLVQMEALSRAIESGDLTRDGFKKALQSIEDWNGGGLLQPVNLTVVPYVTGTRTRILAPDVANKTWTEVAGYAEPKSAAP